MLKKILALNPTMAFSVTFVILFCISPYLYMNVEFPNLIFVMAINLIIFTIYTIIRYNNYLLIYDNRKARRFLLIDNGILLIGACLLYSINYFFYKGTGTINLFLNSLVVILILPTYYRNKALKKMK